MLESEKYAIAASLHVVLRRKLGRVTDVDWMVKNRDYALEVLRVAREQRDPELVALAARFEAAIVPPRPAPPRDAAHVISATPGLTDLRKRARAALDGVRPLADAFPRRGVGSLR